MKVKLRQGQRSFEHDDTNFSIFGAGSKELEEKFLRSYSIKWGLMQGHLIPVEGEAIINVKHARMLFSAEEFPYAYGYEFGKYFQKDLEMDTIVWKARDEISAGIIAKLEGIDLETPEEVEEEPEVELPEEEGTIEEEVETEPEEPEEEVETEPEEVEEEAPKEEAEKYTKTDLMEMTKSEQVQILEDMGLSSKEIKDLKTEPNRVAQILELQG